MSETVSHLASDGMLKRANGVEDGGDAARPAPTSDVRRVDKASPPHSDIGTILLHWVVAITIITSLLTGLRISADAPNAVISKFLSPILPQGEIWTLHFIASLTLFFSATAYVFYLVRGGLRRRISLRKAVVLTLPVAPRLKWGALNVALYWIFYGLVIVLTATGIALYCGYGGNVVAVHAFCALTVLGYIIVHLISHFGYGGWQQLLRVFRPRALVPNRATSRLPFTVAALVGLPVAAGFAALDLGTRDVLMVSRIDRAPKLDGVLDDDAWKLARPIFVRTMQGANLGGSGESTVEIRAVQDGERMYFAFRWEDPTRSLFRLPIVKSPDGWRMTGKKAGEADVVDFYEDKFSVLLSPHDGFGAAGVSHMGPHPVADKPSSLNQRGLHYTTGGETLDMWQWKASRGGMLGFMDDQYMGPIKEPTAAEAAKKARYQGGYWNDPGDPAYTYNFPFDGPGGYTGPIQPRRLPKDHRATTLAMGPFDVNNPDLSSPEGAQTWLTADDSVPYTPELDATIPVGTVIPGVILTNGFTGDRGDLKCGARWHDGYWTLEVSRKLTTGSRYDVDFVPGQPLYMWVSVFDHTQTRHTRHMRAVTVSFR